MLRLVSSCFKGNWMLFCKLHSPISSYVFFCLCANCMFLLDNKYLASCHIHFTYPAINRISNANVYADCSQCWFWSSSTHMATCKSKLYLTGSVHSCWLAVVPKIWSCFWGKTVYCFSYSIIVSLTSNKEPTPVSLFPFVQAFKLIVNDPDSVINSLTREVKEIGPDGQEVTFVCPRSPEPDSSYWY